MTGDMDMPDTQLAVLEAELRHTNRRIEELQAEAGQRRIEQQNDTRMILQEMAKLRLELESGKGFTKGIKFSVSVFWALTGGVIVAALTRLFS